MMRLKYSILLRVFPIVAAMLALLGCLMTQLTFYSALSSEKSHTLDRLNALATGLETAYAGFALQGIEPDIDLMGGIAAQYDGAMLESGAARQGMRLDGHALIASREMRLGKMACVMSIEQNIAPVYESRARLLMAYRIIYVLSAAACAFILYAVSAGITRPIEQLERVSAALSRGELTARAQIHTHDEIESLALSFNTMADTLTDQLARQTRFTQNLTHEMKTPLSAIIGHADLLRSGRMDEAESMLAAQTILSEAKRLNALSASMTEWILLGRDDIRTQVTSARLLLEEVCACYKTSGAEVSFGGDEALIEVDRTLMKTLLTNLVDNALHAGASSVALTATSKDGAVRIAVQDNGTGMDEETLRRATEPFYRGDKARSRAHGGAGLGLALCGGIAQLHGTFLTLESEKGEGTTVSLLLKEATVHD